MAISSLHRGFDASAFLPDDLSAALRRRVREAGGLALIGAYFDVGTGRLSAHDPDAGAFAPIIEMAAVQA